MGDHHDDHWHYSDDNDDNRHYSDDHEDNQDNSNENDFRRRHPATVQTPGRSLVEGDLMEPLVSNRLTGYDHHIILI